MNTHKPISIIGYSGHGYVIADIFLSNNQPIKAYCDQNEKIYNPFQLNYLGSEQETYTLQKLQEFEYFIAIGDNKIRGRVYERLSLLLGKSVNAIHRTAVVSPTVRLEDGIMIAANATVNPIVEIGRGAICNTSSSIDHECIIGEFAHIGPGAVLCGNVHVGHHTFVGANAVVKQGIRIGSNAMIGAGCVVVKDVPDHAIVVGNPQRELIKSRENRLADQLKENGLMVTA